MRILLTCPDALIDSHTGKFFEGIEDALEYFRQQDNEKYEVVVYSSHREALANIPEKFNPFYIPPRQRGGISFIDSVKEAFGCSTGDIVILGAKDKDMQQAANSKLILLNAIYAQANNPEDKLYEKEYGIPIVDSHALKLFFDRYHGVSEPWYYKLEVTDSVRLYSLTNANTLGSVGYQEATLNDEFRVLLKDGRGSRRNDFMIYFLICTYGIVSEFEKVDYWGTYPTSSGQPNPDLEYFLTKARQSFRCRTSEPLLIRHTPVAKRHKTGGRVQRLDDGCDTQFNSIIINPYFEGKLGGKTVCIIDDFTTYGTSCETVRHLLLRAGVSRIIFITLGRFGREYNMYRYRLTGNVFRHYSAAKILAAPTPLQGQFNPAASHEFVELLKKA